MLDAEPDAPSSGALRRWLDWRSGALLLAAAALLGFCVTLYLCAPGFMARDSGTQLEQARAFNFFDDHPVIMALVWHYLDRLVPGPLGMLLLTAALYWAGLGGLFWSWPGSPAVRALAVLGAGFFLPAFSCLPIVLKDAPMHGALLAALALLVVPSQRGRLWRSLAAFVLLAFAIGVRHNAAAAAWPFVALPLLHALPIQGRWRRVLSAGVLGLALTFVLALAVPRALAPLGHRTEFWQTIPAFDLAGMSLQANELLIEPETGLFTQGMGLAQLRTLFRIDYGSQLYYCIAFRGQRCVHLFRRSQDPEDLKQLSGNWLRAIRQHPGAYLAHRYQFARTLLTTNRSNKELYYLAGAPHHPLAADYPPSERNVRVMAWIERQLKRRLYQPWIYALLCVVLVSVGLWRYARTGQAVCLALALSGGSYLLSTIVGANSTDYRYSVWTILCALLSLLAAVLSPSTALWSRRALSSSRGSRSDVASSPNDAASPQGAAASPESVPAAPLLSRAAPAGTALPAPAGSGK